MNIEREIESLRKEYLALEKKYCAVMPCYEFGYGLIRFSVKMLMDKAPRHGVALQTIKVATEEGIKWHVEERAEGEKNNEK